MSETKVVRDKGRRSADGFISIWGAFGTSGDRLMRLLKQGRPNFMARAAQAHINAAWPQGPFNTPLAPLLAECPSCVCACSVRSFSLESLGHSRLCRFILGASKGPRWSVAARRMPSRGWHKSFTSGHRTIRLGRSSGHGSQNARGPVSVVVPYRTHEHNVRD